MSFPATDNKKTNPTASCTTSVIRFCIFRTSIQIFYPLSRFSPFPLVAENRLQIKSLPAQIVATHRPQSKLRRPDFGTLQIFAICRSESGVGGGDVRFDPSEIYNGAIIHP